MPKIRGNSMQDALMLPGMREYFSREWRARIDSYARKHAGTYRGFAAYITPADYSPEETFRRVAFSILSVQTPFDKGCAAFEKIAGMSWEDREDYAKVKSTLKRSGGIMYYATKATGILIAAGQCRKDHKIYLRGPEESWHAYRQRLARKIYGIGKAKGTFLACLLYPNSADLACLDTWILRRFGFPPEKNGRLTWEEYLDAEKAIRKHARRWEVSTFVAQWIIWDCDRGSVESHSILGRMPGGHKATD